MTDNVKPYIVTARTAEDSGSILHDVALPGSTSEYVPDREVEVHDLRIVNALNTTYLLTDVEADQLRSDPRVDSVEHIEDLPIEITAFQTGNFSKGSFSNGLNWGLLRHTSVENLYGIGTSSGSNTYDYVLDGTGVDIVILDTGIQPDHPEFHDSNGNSRVREINWFAESGVSGTMPSNHYTDYQGHGTHVASIAAGRTFGWARNADIYAIKMLKVPEDPNNVISVSTAFDCLLGWHSRKTNGRPTVINNSWSYIIYNRQAERVFSFSQTGGTTYRVNGGSYRGTPWTGDVLDISKGHSSSTQYGYPVNSVDADISQLIDAGIFVCNSAGNSGLKNDVEGGVDYNNTINLTGLGNLFYHRAGSPNVKNKKGFQVGSVGIGVTNDFEEKTSFSNSGPNVGIYSAGSFIMGALSNFSSYFKSPYHLDSNYSQGVLSGTSMASPQVAGIAALILQVHPDWSPTEVHNYIINNSTQKVYSSGLDNDYNDIGTIHGGPSRLLYLPMNGRKIYSISG